MPGTTIIPPPKVTNAPPGPVAGSTVAIVQQPGFDPLLFSKVSSPFGTPPLSLQRGYMIWDPTTAPEGYGTGSAATSQATAVRFQFNPSTVQASYQLSDSTVQAALIYNPTGGTQPFWPVPLQQQISFTVMFDRTFELITHTTTNTTLANTQGCWVDVLCMCQFTGMFASLYAGNNQAVSSTANNCATGFTTADLSALVGKTGVQGSFKGSIPQGVMQVTLCYVNFAGGGSTASPNPPLQYYGYIDSWSVQFTHFNSNMVPIRCVVDVSFTLLPPPSATSSPGTAGAAITQQQLANPLAAHITAGRQ